MMMSKTTIPTPMMILIFISFHLNQGVNTRCANEPMMGPCRPTTSACGLDWHPSGNLERRRRAYLPKNQDRPTA